MDSRVAIQPQTDHLDRPPNLERESGRAAEDDQVTITDLDQEDLAGRSMCFWLASTVLKWQRFPQRRYWRLAWLPSFLLGLVVVLLMSQGFSSVLVKSLTTALLPPSPPSPSLIPLPQQDGITCLTDAAWSPDSTTIAVLGYGRCYQPGAAGSVNRYGIVNLYDAHSRKLVVQFHPEAAITDALIGSASFPRRDLVAMTYVHLLWSPDGRSLACTFTVQRGPVEKGAVPRESDGKQPVLNGVVLLDRDGRHPQVLLQPQSHTASLYAEWDLAHRRALSFTPLPSASGSMPFPPALAYHWGTNGALVPEILLSRTSLPAPFSRGPVGAPDGGASFSLWQPGALTLDSWPDGSSGYTWRTNFAAWSPNGHYLVDGMSLLGVLTPPGRLVLTHRQPLFSTLSNVPLAPAHDVALLQLLQSWTVVAWSPKGQLLAASQGGKSVQLFDCRTGNRLASFELLNKQAASPSDSLLLRWSPDGKYIASVGDGGVVQLWNAASGK
jgi:hypothetical protein